MCGRFTLAKEASELARAFPALPAPPRLARRYNIAPAQPVGAWIADPSPRWELFTWGLIPHWAKQPPERGGFINARAETAAEKPAFRDAFRRKRCLVPADGWYEWTRRDGRAVPMYFDRVDGNPFVFAGLWDEWHDREGGMVLGLSILTTRPNALARRIHPRMPAILREEDVRGWIDPGTPPAELPRMLEPVAADGFRVREVNPAVNQVRAEGPALLDPPPARPRQGELDLFA